MTATTSRTDWILFIILGFLWGSSFLFIKIGVEAGLPRFTLVMLRLLIGFGLLAIVVTAARERLPRDARIYGHLFVMGAINIAIALVNSRIGLSRFRPTQTPNRIPHPTTGAATHAN
jgi:drug/metabolite transporter (DMT)-like permease